jgi:hypothetical protein
MLEMGALAVLCLTHSLAQSNSPNHAAGNGDMLFVAAGDIHIPVGVYTLHRTAIVRSDTRIRCDRGAALTDSPTSKLGALLKIEGHNISIDGCELFSQASPLIVAVGSHTGVLSLSNNSFHSVHFAHAIWIDSPDIHDVEVTRNRFEHVGYGVGQNVHAGDLSEMRIADNVFINLLGDGVELNNPVTSNCCGVKLKTTTASKIVIVHNTFNITRLPESNRNAGFCVGVAGAHDVTIESNRCAAWNEGIHVEDRAYSVKIINNQITTNDSTGHPHQSAIQVIDGHDIDIENNEIGGMGDGIHVDYDPTHQVNDIKIVGNNIAGCRGVGISIATGSLGPIDANILRNTIGSCGLPMVLIGNLIKMTIAGNKFTDGDKCPFNYGARTKRSEVNVYDNVDTYSGKPIADCEVEAPAPLQPTSW